MSVGVGSPLAALAAHAARTPRPPGRPRRGSALDFGELLDRVERTAAGLASAGVTTGDRVALSLPNSVDFLVSALACLAAGATFVPLPFGDPPARLDELLRDARPRLVVAREPGAAPLADWPGATPDALRGPARADVTRLTGEGPAGREPPAYCIYTSGTTGRPKGVVVGRRALATAVAHTAGPFGFHAGTRALCVSPFHFDGSFGSLFSVLGAGGSLVISTRELVMLPRAFFRAVGEHGITHTTFSPSFLRLLVDSPDLGQLADSDLRTVGLGGEDCSLQDLRTWTRVVPQARIFNRYGPTEATIAVSTFEITPEVLRVRDKVPIGRPHPGTGFHLVDASGERVDAPGVVGELYLSGDQLMDGYWRDPELTAEVLRGDVVPGHVVYRTGDLVRRDEAGDYVYVDRADNVINRNGVRLSLAEVRRAVERLGPVTAAVCDADGSSGDVRVTAFVTVDRPCTRTDLRRELVSTLPVAMIPDEIVIVGDLPLTGPGKVDVAELRRCSVDRR